MDPVLTFTAFPSAPRVIDTAEASCPWPVMDEDNDVETDEEFLEDLKHAVGIEKDKPEKN